METQPQVKMKLNVHRLITFILVFIATMLGAILVGWIPPDPVGIMVGLVFVGFMAFIGYLADKSGLAKYRGWNKNG